AYRSQQSAAAAEAAAPNKAFKFILCSHRSLVLLCDFYFYATQLNIAENFYKHKGFIHRGNTPASAHFTPVWLLVHRYHNGRKGAGVLAAWRGSGNIKYHG